jgi:hypothetical protein
MSALPRKRRSTAKMRFVALGPGCVKTHTAWATSGHVAYRFCFANGFATSRACREKREKAPGRQETSPHLAGTGDQKSREDNRARNNSYCGRRVSAFRANIDNFSSVSGAYLVTWMKRMFGPLAACSTV